jgi:hypothetical protein
MARKVTQEINWKPRRVRNLEHKARLTRLQASLPELMRGMLAGDESRVVPVAEEPDQSQAKSKSTLLLWEPRSQQRNSKQHRSTHINHEPNHHAGAGSSVA